MCVCGCLEGGGRQKVATGRNMRREERVTVQGPVKEQQPDEMSHRGAHLDIAGAREDGEAEGRRGGRQQCVWEDPIRQHLPLHVGLPSLSGLAPTSTFKASVKLMETFGTLKGTCACARFSFTGALSFTPIGPEHLSVLYCLLTFFTVMEPLHQYDVQSTQADYLRGFTGLSPPSPQITQVGANPPPPQKN